MVRGVLILAVTLFATMLVAQTQVDEASIRKIVEEENATWNKGDADGYSRHFAEDGTFTNIRGTFFTGYKAFRDQHETIFKGIFLGTTLHQDIVSLRFLHADVAIMETLTAVSGFPKTGPPPGIHLDDKGRLRTRLLQVLIKRGEDWKIVAYHNVDIKPGIPVPEPQ